MLSNSLLRCFMIEDSWLCWQWDNFLGFGTELRKSLFLYLSLSLSLSLSHTHCIVDLSLAGALLQALWKPWVWGLICQQKQLGGMIRYTGFNEYSQVTTLKVTTERSSQHHSDTHPHTHTHPYQTVPNELLMKNAIAQYLNTAWTWHMSRSS